jgi:hypothetical protein
MIAHTLLLCILATLAHESIALSFAAKIAEKNLACELQSTTAESSQLLSGALFGFAQLPNVIGWFASEFLESDTGDRVSLLIKPISDKRYPYLIVGGISTEPINRRLAVARDRGMDVIDIVSKKTLAEIEFPACLGSLSELQFDAASGNLYGLAFSTLAADGVSCTGQERELLIQVDYIANKLVIVAEPDSCSIQVGASTFDYANRHYYFIGHDCSGGKMGIGVQHLYRIDVSGDDGKTADNIVAKLPVPTESVALIKWSQTAQSSGGTFFVMAQVNAPSFDFSLAKLDPATGKVSQLSDKAHRVSSLILNAAATVDGPNNIMLIQNVEGSFDVLSLSTGEKLQNVGVTFNAADTTGYTGATTTSGSGTTQTTGSTAAPNTSSGTSTTTSSDGNVTTATAPASSGFTTTASGNTSDVGTATTAPFGQLATIGSIQLAPTCICCSRRQELARPDHGAIMKKRNIAPLNEDLVKACDAAATPQSAAVSLIENLSVSISFMIGSAFLIN